MELGRRYHRDPRTVRFVRDNFMVGIKCSSLADSNRQTMAHYNKVSGKICAAANEVPFERLKKETPFSRAYIIDKINLRRVQKDCILALADGLVKKLYEANAMGRLSDKHFSRLRAKHDEEQTTLGASMTERQKPKQAA